MVKFYNKDAAKSMRSQVRKSGVRKRADLSLEEIAQLQSNFKRMDRVLWAL